MAKESAKTVAKETSKVVAKTATTAATTAAGTAVSPGVGTVIGIAAGEVVGEAVAYKMDKQDMTNNVGFRKIKFFLDKMKAQDEQTDSLAKLVKDIFVQKGMFVAKYVAKLVLPILLGLVLLVSVVAIPVVAIVGTIYNSPFAIFLPPLEDGDTVTTVASAYVADFNREVNELKSNHIGYDDGKIVYVGYEGEGNPSNYYDILAVYMVKYGVGDTATIMNDTSRGWLKSVVDDMCTYTTSTGSETETVENEDGTTTTTTTTYLYVNVTLKSCYTMANEYGFTQDQMDLLVDFMSPENLAILGYSPGGGGGDPGVCSLTEAEIQAVLDDIPDGAAKDACDFALHRVGYPYSQDLRHSGTHFDCSSLVYYAWLDAGVDISFGGATTAGYEAQGLANAGKTTVYEDMQPGDLIFFSYEETDGYLDISHVGIYVGNGKMVDARGTAYGVVYRDVPPNTGAIVMIGRPN